MKLTVVLLIISLLIGCSVDFDVTIHDEDKAADLVSVFLVQVNSQDGMKAAYDNAHEGLRESSTFNMFSEGVSQLLKYNAGATVSIFGYETIGTDEFIIVYAKSIVGKSTLYYRFSFAGSKAKGYSLYNFNANTKGYEYKGYYSKYSHSIDV